LDGKEGTDKKEKEFRGIVEKLKEEKQLLVGENHQLNLELLQIGNKLNLLQEMYDSVSLGQLKEEKGNYEKDNSCGEEKGQNYNEEREDNVTLSVDLRSGKKNKENKQQ